MCVTPNKIYIEKHGQLTVACRQCGVCRFNKINDWIGRCYGESLYSDHTVALTLTYSDETHEKRGSLPTELNYEDVQVFIRKLRDRGIKVRYIVTGEYGTEKGRAHWHIILFFKQNFDLPENQRANWPFFRYDTDCWMYDDWPHGFTYAQLPSYESFKYCLKYLLKELDSRGFETGTKPFFRMSRFPLIGYEHIVSEAKKAAEMGAIPKNPTYRFEAIVNKSGPNKGRSKVFFLQGRAAEIYKTTFLIEHFKKRGRQWMYGAQMLLDFQRKPKNSAVAGCAIQAVENMVQGGKIDGVTYDPVPLRVAFRKELDRLEADRVAPVMAEKVLVINQGLRLERGIDGQYYAVWTAKRDFSECHAGLEKALLEKDLEKYDTWLKDEFLDPAKKRLATRRVVFAENRLKELSNEYERLAEVCRHVLRGRSEIRAAIEGRLQPLSRREHPELPQALQIATGDGLKLIDEHRLALMPLVEARQQQKFYQKAA